MKGLATSGNEEPTNSSSAERLHPTTKKEKAQKSSSAAQARPEADTHLEKGDEQSNGIRREPMAEAESVKRPLSIKELRRLARKPGIP